MTTLLSVPALKERGWTDTLIHDLLGCPDATRPNPHRRSGPAMRLYDPVCVEAVEASDAWAERIARARKRQEASTRAAETKRAKLLARLETVTITVPVIAMDDLTQSACDDYNERQMETGRWEGATASPSSDPEFLLRITVNYLRHVMSGYDGELLVIFGRVGVREGYAEINRKAYAAIAAAYPALAGECQRPIEAKFGI